MDTLSDIGRSLNVQSNCILCRISNQKVSIMPETNLYVDANKWPVIFWSDIISLSFDLINYTMSLGELGGAGRKSKPRSHVVCRFTYPYILPQSRPDCDFESIFTCFFTNYHRKTAAVKALN